MEDLRDASVAIQRFQMSLMVLLAAAGLLITSVGIYGVVSELVTRSTREIGVRMALGARQWQIQSWVFRRALVPVLVGIIAGMAASVPLGRVLRNLLFEVSPADPSLFAGAMSVTIAVSLLASYLPGRRAVRTNPIIALRAE
jgi:ABC-type antimicrobial peptide transport system permease subunit